MPHLAADSPGRTVPQSGAAAYPLALAQRNAAPVLQDDRDLARNGAPS
jgi:hypothetical protein